MMEEKKNRVIVNERYDEHLTIFIKIFRVIHYISWKKRCFQNLLSANCLSPRTTCILSSYRHSIYFHHPKKLVGSHAVSHCSLFIHNRRARFWWKSTEYLSISSLINNQVDAAILAIIMKFRVDWSWCEQKKIVKCLSSQSRRGKTTQKKK